MRVLFYAPLLGRGGVHRFTIDLLTSLRRVAGADTLQTAVLGQRRDEQGQPIAWVDENFIPLDPPLPAKTAVDPALRFYQIRRYQERWFRQLQQVVADRKIDTVYLAHPWWSLRVPLPQVALNAHVTLTLFDFAFDTLDWNNAFGDGFRDEARRFGRFASHTAFFSAPTRDHALARYGFAPERTSVIWPGPFLPANFDPSAANAEAVRAKYKLPPSYLLAFHSAGHKRPGTIIQAAGQLKRTSPDRFYPVVFAGLETDKMHPRYPASDAYIAECQRLVGEGDLIPDRDIFFLGRVDDDEIAGLYANAIASITASRSEAGISGTIFETLKADVPLIYSDIPAHVDRLGLDGAYGLHFRLDDAADLARAILRVLSDPGAAKQTARRARQAILDGYGWDDAAGRYLQVFERLMTQAPAIPRVKAPLTGVAASTRWSAQHTKHAQAAPDSPIQVLIYAPVVGRGGVRRLLERMLHTWLRHADPQRWRFKVLSHAVDEIGQPVNWPSGDILIPLEPRLAVSPDDAPTHIFNFLNETRQTFYEQFQHHARSADVVWLPHPWWTLRVDAAQSGGVEAHIIPTVHDFGFDVLGWNDVFGDGFRREARVFTEVAHKLIFSSRTIMQHAIQHYDLPRHKGEVVYLGDFIPDNFQPSKEALGQLQAKFGLPDRFFLAFHAAGHKDPRTIIQAAAILRDTHPDYFYPLVIAGIETQEMIPGNRSNNPYTLSIQELIPALGLEVGRDLYILGYVTDEEVNGLYEGAAACITASRSEAGLSAAIFEALAARKPIVFSNLPQFTERLGVQREYGVHFRLGEPESLAEALIEALRSPDVTQARIEKGYQLFIDRTWQHIAQEYLQVFEEAARIPLPVLEAPAHAPIIPPAMTGSASSAAPVAVTGEVRRSAQRLSGLRTRVKLYTLNRLLPKINLTSHNALLRVHRMKDDVTIQLEIARQELTQSARDRGALEQQLESGLREIERLAGDTRELDDLRAMFLQTQSEIAQAERAIKALTQQRETDRQAAQEKLAISVQRVGELEQQLADLQQAVEKAAGELRAAHAALDDSGQRISGLEQQLELKQRSIEEAAVQQQAAQDEQNRLEAQLADAANSRRLLRQQLDYQTRQFARVVADPQQLSPYSVPVNSDLSAVERVVLFQKMVHHHAAPLEALSVLERLPDTHDAIYNNVLLPLYQEKLGGLRNSFWDIRIALNVLSRLLRPRHYLEVGTRVGWSLAQVLAHTPDVEAYCFDSWIVDYAGSENPGAAFVERQMRLLVSNHENLSLNFISGNSHDTLPQFFYPEMHSRTFDLKRKPPETFDLISVDGDHSLLGAWWDLDMLMPRVAVGGAIVFDDLEIEATTTGEVPETKYPAHYAPLPANLKSLRDVWGAIKARYPQFVTIETGDQPIATVVAIRVE